MLRFKDTRWSVHFLPFQAHEIWIVSPCIKSSLIIIPPISYTASEGDIEYYVNLCGAASYCESDISVCDNKGHQIASYTDQYMMIEGILA